MSVSSMDPAVHRGSELSETLLRFSVGFERETDLLHYLNQALAHL